MPTSPIPISRVESPPPPCPTTASNTKAWRPRSWIPRSSTGCKTICGSSRDSTDAYAPFMPLNRIGWRWARSLPSTMPETSTRFGATSSHGPSLRQAPTPRSSTSPAWNTPKPFCPASPPMPRSSHVSLAKASATASPSSARPPAKRRAAPWYAGWQKTSSRM